MSANATTTNTQATRQRAAILGRNNENAVSKNLGIKLVRSESQFSGFNPVLILDKSKDVFNTTNVAVGENPDFQQVVSLVYAEGENLYTSVTGQSDRPNERGPQLKTIKIGDNGAPDTASSNLSLNSGSQIPENRGFGVTEETQPFPGRYNSPDREGSSTLGDYITPAE
jgi:hypothetical protein